MRKTYLPTFILLMAVLLHGSNLWAQQQVAGLPPQGGIKVTPPAQVTKAVPNPFFSLNQGWLQIQFVVQPIAVLTAPAIGSTIPYINKVKFQLFVGFPDQYIANLIHYYECDVTAISLAKNQQYNIYFFIPPEEITSMGFKTYITNPKLQTKLQYALLVSVNGVQQTGINYSTNMYSSSLPTQQQRNQFIAQALAGSPANAGIMIPTQLLPQGTPQKLRVKSEPRYVQ